MVLDMKKRNVFWIFLLSLAALIVPFGCTSKDADSHDAAALPDMKIPPERAIFVSADIAAVLHDLQK